MRRVRWMGVMACLAFLFSPEAGAEEGAVATQRATYRVPNLTMERATKMAEALSSHPGVVSAEPDLEKKLFSVTYEVGKACPGRILQALSAVAPGTELEGVGEAQEGGDKGGCGGCPFKSACGK